MFNIELIDNERSCTILVKYKVELESETTIPLSMITEDYLNKEIDRLKYNLLKLTAMELANEKDNINV